MHIDLLDFRFAGRPFLAASVAASLLLGLQGGTRAHDLPLGDGKVSSAPKIGYVFSCRQRFDPNAPGARASGDWLGTSTWEPARKPFVQGSVNWPSSISMVLNGDTRILQGNNLPTHPTGVFPIRRDDPAYAYDRNPGRITAQDIRLELPAIPRLAAEPSCVSMGMIGFTLTNGALYNALDARGHDAPAHEMQDRCSGHPQQTGQYHYHNMSPCAFDNRTQPNDHSDLIGYALDGFGLFGLFGEGGKKLTNADLDACHGHTHAINWDGKVRTLYHYHATDEYPYTIGCFRGTPVSTATASVDGGGDRQPPRPNSGGQGGRDHQVLSAAAAELGVSTQQLRDAIGRPPPDFARASQMLGMPASRIRQAMQKARRGH